MKVIPKLQQGNTIESDNTKVVRPEIHEPIKAKPKQYSIVDLGGEPSNDTRSAAERNRDYWHPIKGAKARFKASMSNETNPLIGIERTILPSAAGAALVTTPAAVVGGALGNMTVDKLTGGWGNWLEDKTGIPSEIGVYTNPGAWYGGAKGYKIGKNKLITKSIKGDVDLAWNPINKNHWIFNKEARTPSNIAMETANRITPFLSKVEKLPLKVAAYKAAKRTNGNASVSLQDIKTMPADYTGSSILGGGNLEGRNLLAKYIFDENPVVKRMFFNKATSNIKPISRNEARRGFSHGDRYEQLYPGVHNRRYEMSAVVPSGRPLKFENVTKFTDYAGKNPIGKVVGKETEPVMRMGDKEFMTFRQPGTDYIGPIDDVAGHLVKFQMNKGKLRQTSQDMWKFNPADYAKRWNDSPNTANQVRLTKQAALMDKVGRPFILQQSNPIWIEGKSVRNPELVTMAHGGRFGFKKSPLLKKQEEINGKRDMRKKFIKSSRPIYKKRIKKAQQGMRFVSYNPVSNPTIDYTDITNPINPFSEYNFNTVYDKPEALVVPVRDTNEPDVVANNPIAEPVINKPVASKSVTDKPVTKTANSTWKSPYTNRRQWSTELINAYKKAGITNDNAIRMLLAQDALESSWGKSAQGKYNFGNLTTGSSWKGDYVTGNDKNAKGEAIKQKFRSYNSMDEYAADKVQFLKRLYDFDENDDINKFVAKLTGSNKGKRRYAEATNYAKVLTGVYNGIPKGENGMIIKYQEPAQPIKYMGGYDKRGNMVLPVTNENGMNNVTLPEVTVTPRNINLAGAVDRGRREAAPYVSTLLTGAIFGPLSVAGGYAGNEAVNKITNVASNDKYKDWADMLSKTTGMNPVVADFFNIGNLAGGFGMRNFGPKLKPVKDMAVGGNKWARARVISKAIDKGTPSVEPLPNNVGWGPRQSIHVVHDKNSARFPKLYFPERWDAVNEGAPEAGIWYQGKLGNPRTAANHSVPGKAEKAAKARERFAKRPYRVEGDLELERPIVTVGDVPNRAALERAADKMSADGVIFNNVYDNGYSNNQVIFSLRDDLKNGRVFKKGAKPLEKSQFIDTGTSMNGDLDINKNIQNFVEYLLNPETQQRIASIDAELGTKYGEAAKRFVDRYNNGNLTVLPRNKRDVGLDNDIIKFSRSVPSEEILTTKDFDRIAFEILRDDFAHVPGHEAKHGIETVQAALLKDMTPTEYHQYAKTGGPRLQALMKDNIVSEDEFVKRIMKEHPEYNEVSVRNKYKYLTIPSEFNSQLHPLIEFEQRAGKSGVPNFKSVDEIDRLINNNPYVGTSENNGLRNLRLLFNYIIKDKNEFMRRFNKYGFGVVPATTIINNYDNE
jgi:flagellum-specific peptidoglycan hydrolase FlgJ